MQLHLHMVHIEFALIAFTLRKTTNTETLPTNDMCQVTLLLLWACLWLHRKHTALQVERKAVSLDFADDFVSSTVQLAAMFESVLTMHVCMRST